MVLESTMICVDSSDYMRNGDFLPTRLQAQQAAAHLICHSKTRSNPENDIGLITLANVEVLATLTNNVGHVLSKLNSVQPKGNISLYTGIRIAQLALKHRQGKHHKMRIVAFVGSPVAGEEKELVALAKKLKKEKVNVDIINFGEDAVNTETLAMFINTLNGKDTSGSHLITIPSGSNLSDALLSSPIIQGEYGAGGTRFRATRFEFGIEPDEDPELAMALRISMEEHRQRQENEARRAREASTPKNKAKKLTVIEEDPFEESLLVRSDNVATPSALEFANMTEEEQITYAIQQSMQDAEKPSSSTKQQELNDEDYAELMNDPTFIQNVLENLPGVDPQSEEVRQAVENLKNKKKESKDDEQQKK